MRKTLLITLVFFLLLIILIIFISFFVINQRSSFFGRATSDISESDVSADNSYLFASPLQAASADQEKIRVTVFLLNSKGLGVSGKKVKIGTDMGINVQEIQAVTDGYGKAIFDIWASNPGEYLLEASTESSTLPQKVRVTFN